MSHRKDSDASQHKRRSFFGRTPLIALSPAHSRNGSSSGDKDTLNVLKKRRTASSLGSLTTNFQDGEARNWQSESLESPAVPQALGRTSSGRPLSLMGSWRLSRSFASNDEPKSSTSTRAPSFNWLEPLESTTKSRLVLHHGEVITRSTMLSKKTEYLVLTETHLVRFKSAQKAADMFPGISPIGRSSSYRHSQSPSTGSLDFPYAASETSGERQEGIPLRQLVAVYQLDDGRPYFALEIVYLDDETNHASTMTLQFAVPEDMYVWLRGIRHSADQVRQNDPNPISQHNSILAARIVERERDYEPPNYSIYKVVQRAVGKAGARSSTDDLSKLANNSSQRGSAPSLSSYNEQSSYGIMTLTSLRINDYDDGMELTFRSPLQKPKVLHLATLASHDIAVRLRSVEVRLRPEWESRPYVFDVPDDVKNDILRDPSPRVSDPLECLDRALIAYCMAYDVNPENIRYRVSDMEEDGPCFELLPPADPRQKRYTVNELLAVMRSLRYNEAFGSISFAGVSLDALNGLVDKYGNEHLCTKTKRGTPIQMEYDALLRASILVQELRALAITSKKVRRMDFTSCITRKPPEFGETLRGRDLGCGIVEAIFPLCIYNTTNVDWLTLNNIHLGETDLDYVVQAVVERQCHFRALGLSNCGLNDRTLNLILESLRPQESTLEALDLSRNPSRITPSSFDSQISAFAFIRKLNLSYISKTSGPEPLLSHDTLQSWRLQELILTGTSLNPASVDAIAIYLANHKQSRGLRELRLDHTYLSGKEIAVLLQALTETPGQGRDLHLDVSENNIERGLPSLRRTIAAGYAPQFLSVREIEFEDEGAFRKLILAFAANKTITHLDISKASLPCDASEETCQALEKLFFENKTLEYLDISGEESRLESSKLGKGINRALHGLKNNSTLRVLRIQYQKLGLQGASTLADVLKTNTGLRELHCENNGIPLSGFTDLVNALHRNTTLVYIPPMTESKQLALKQTEDEIKQVRDSHGPGQMQRSSIRSKFANRVGMGSHGKEKMGVATMLSDQDIKAALSLVDESWSRQMYRLQAFLQRNQDIADGIPTRMDIDEEDFEKPSAVRSVTSLLEQVKIDTTPTFEKELAFHEEVVETSNSDDSLEKKLEMRTSPRSPRSPTGPPAGL